MVHDGPIVAGMRTSIVFQYTTGDDGLRCGGRIRIGVPNTGWEKPVPPQQRYWDELVQGAARQLAPFLPVNTTAAVESCNGAMATLHVMERMLVPDEDPALAYWRWWITATIEGADLASGDLLQITYGDLKFGGQGIQVQTFPENEINIMAFVQPAAGDHFLLLTGCPAYFDVVSGEPARANAIVPSTHSGPEINLRVSLTDACHCRPRAQSALMLAVGGEPFECIPGTAKEVRFSSDRLAEVQVIEAGTGAVWGKPNPSVPVVSDGLQLFWGDLHAQSEHHVMHSQKMDFRQLGWSKGISCGTLDECYEYGREVACLDFVAITDQGACLTDAWEYCQTKVREYHDPGRFVTFKAYEAGSPLGHRNVIYSTDEVEPPLDRERFHSFHPSVLFAYYKQRADAILIPHHVKTWTDWSFHDPELEPVMEIYSCWGQSESPGMDLWNKGMTPGAGAWVAFEKGYRLGMIASSDNHVGMPGRSYPGDRQAHTPFKGGLCAIWAEELHRESLFQSLRQRRCYGTTGARIVVRFTIDGHPMGSVILLPPNLPDHGTVRARIEVRGTEELRTIEVVSPRGTVRVFRGSLGQDRVDEIVDLPRTRHGFYYLRITQSDNERAWTSPIFFEVTP